MPGLPPLFDATKYIGAGFPEHPDFLAGSDLLAHLDRLGIDRAVVWHTEARGAHPMAGNEQLIREIATAGAQHRLVPSFAIAPSMTAESGVMDRFLDAYSQARHEIFCRQTNPQDRLGGAVSKISRSAGNDESLSRSGKV